MANVICEVVLGSPEAGISLEVVIWVTSCSSYEQLSRSLHAARKIS